MDLSKLRDQLIDHEGLRFRPYRCTAGKLTIGVGRNIEDRGISKDEAMMLLTNDIAESANDVVSILGSSAWDKLTDARQRALVDLRFNLGSGGFRAFKQMIQAVKDGRYDDASREMLDSKWAKQVQSERVQHLTRMMREGV